MSDKNEVQYVPVLDKNNEPLMPCHPARARQLLRKGKAVRRWFRGVFAIKLTEREGGVTQPIAVGVDPGSKREGFTVKSNKHTFINIQSVAIDWIHSKIETRRAMRRARRQRNAPYRKPRLNRRKGKNWIPPSTKSRWDLKLRVIKYLKKLYPLTDIVVEDVRAESKKGKRLWNKYFSPLQIGKNWFYQECRQLGSLTTITGKRTSELRDEFGLAKNKYDKLYEHFNVHCVDSWIIANSVVGGHKNPDVTSVLYIESLKFFRRQLHRMQCQKGAIRSSYGGTRSLGFVRGSLVFHKKRGLTYVGGSPGGRVSLHSLKSGKRVCSNAKVSDIIFFAHLSWRWKNE